MKHPEEIWVKSKFEAYKGRGGNDFRQSTDFEDIIYIFDNSPNLKEIITNAKSDVQLYLIKECKKLLNNNNITEGIECALPYNSESERVEILKRRIRSVAEINNK